MELSFKEKLGQRIKKLRTEEGLKSVTFAEMSHISPQSLSQYEAGVHEPSLETLLRMAKALDLTLDELVG